MIFKRYLRELVREKSIFSGCFTEGGRDFPVEVEVFFRGCWREILGGREREILEFLGLQQTVGGFPCSFEESRREVSIAIFKEIFLLGELKLNSSCLRNPGMHIAFLSSLIIHCFSSVCYCSFSFMLIGVDNGDHSLLVEM